LPDRGRSVRDGPIDVYVTKFTPMRHNLSGRNRKTTMKLVVDQTTQKILGVHMLARTRRRSFKASPSPS